MKTFKHIFTIALITSILASCSLENGFIQKRKYNKGYHLSLKKNTGSNKRTDTETISPNKDIVTNSIKIETSTEKNEIETSTHKENHGQVEGLNNTGASNDIETSNDAITQKAERINNKFSTHKRQSLLKSNNLIRNNTSSKKPNSTTDDVALILLVILAFLLPPIAVGLYTNWDTIPVVINIILTLLFWLPGIIHALLVIFDII